MVWSERIAMAEQDGDAPRDSDGARLVGGKLAEATVRRWFVRGSFDLVLLQAKIQKIKYMIYTNRLDRFMTSVQALYSYDLRIEIKDARVPGTFVVGARDSPLLVTMKEMADSYGSGAELHVIDQAGHLPIIEAGRSCAGSNEIS
jgi:pimeloyl-ACP methyl ester carboxylesterase